MKQIRLYTIYYLSFSFFIYFYGASLAYDKNNNLLLKEHIEKYDLSKVKGDRLILLKELNAIKEIKKALGTKNIYFISRYLVSDAEKFLNKDKPEIAIPIIKAAISISPDLHYPHLLLSKAYLKKGFFSLNKGIKPLLTGSYLYITNFDNCIKGHFLAVSMVTLAFAYILLFLILFSKFFKNIVYDLSRSFSIWNLTGRSSIILSFLLIFTVLNVGGIFIFILFLPVILFGYIEKRGKFLLVSFFIFLLFLPLLLKSYSEKTIFSMSGLYSSVRDMTTDTWDERGFDLLKEANKKYPDNWIINFSLGTIYKKKGDFKSATAFFKKVLDSNITHAEVFINMGNSFYGDNDFDDALRYYKRAIEIDDHILEAYVNLGKVYGDLGDIEESTEAFDKAIKLDAEQAIYHMNETEEYFNKKTVDSSLPINAMKQIKTLMEHEIDENYSGLWGIFFAGLSPFFYNCIISACFIVMILYNQKLMADEGYSTLCQNCGKIYNTSSYLNNREYRRCNDCATIEIKSYHIDITKKKEIEERITGYKMRVRLLSCILDVLLPGAGNIYKLNIISGYLLTALTAYIIVETVNYAIFHTSGTAGFMVFCMVIITYYSAVNILLNKKNINIRRAG